MKVAVFYQSNSEQERKVIDFERDYIYQTGRQITLYDLNTRDGWSSAALYDITQYPAVIAVTDDGQLLQLWQGENLPLISDISFYALNA